jgi:hypothetical protein
MGLTRTDRDAEDESKEVVVDERDEIDMLTGYMYFFFFLFGWIVINTVDVNLYYIIRRYSGYHNVETDNELLDRVRQAVRRLQNVRRDVTDVTDVEARRRLIRGMDDVLLLLSRTVDALEANVEFK